MPILYHRGLGIGSIHTPGGAGGCGGAVKRCEMSFFSFIVLIFHIAPSVDTIATSCVLMARGGQRHRDEPAPSRLARAGLNVEVMELLKKQNKKKNTDHHRKLEQFLSITEEPGASVALSK